MEYEINLEALVKMKRVFEEADEDGSGELDIEEFTQKLGPHLGQHLSEAQIAQLFLKIDADCGGTIDWDEFTNFFFLQRGVTTGAAGQQFRLHPKATWRKEWAGDAHREGVHRVYCCEPLERYITCGRDGGFRLWNTKDLAPVQTVAAGSAWTTDVAYLPAARKLLVASMDRSLTFYDVVRHSFEFGGRLTAAGQLGSPQCLAVLEGGGEPRIFYGDTTGAVMQLRCGLPEARAVRAMAPGKDFAVLHQEHSDWVTQLLDIPDVGLLSASLDATVKILDLARGAVVNTFGLHRKGVRSLAYSRAFSLVASAGAERSVLLWPPKGNINRKVGELAGNGAGVVQVVMADACSQAITLAEDHTIRVWDLRNHSCIQTISRADWLRADDARPEAMMYDARSSRLVTAAACPALWEHRAVVSSRGHSGPLCSALYNSAFHVVVSGDQSGNILMWNAQSGECEGGFSFSSTGSGSSGGGGGSQAGTGGSGKLTAMAFDANQRRLLTASEAGEVKMWNFNSGAVLREYQHREGQREVTAVAFLAQGRGPEAAAAAGQAAAQEPWWLGTADGGAAGGGSSDTGGADGSESQGIGGGDEEEGKEEDGEEEGLPCLVLATGWSRNVCIWEDGEGHVVSSRRRLRQHDADVLCMACLGDRVVATGDFEGGIKLWDLQAGCCIASLSYGGAQWERAVGKLAFLPAAAASCSSCSGEEGPASASSGAALLLACGQDGRIKAWRLQLTATEQAGADPVQAGQGEAAPCADERRATASSLRARPCTTAPSAPGSRGRERPGTTPYSTPGSSPRPPPLSCEAAPAVELPAALRAGDCVTAVAVDTAGSRLLTGDSSGHVRVWDVSTLNLSSATAAKSSFRQVGQWRARQRTIVSLQLLPQRGLLLLASDDSTVSIWTLKGGLVGVFGQHKWDLDDSTTWQDPAGPACEQSPPSTGGLTPRQILCRTPRKTHWPSVGGGSGAGSGGGPTASPRRPGQSSAAQRAAPAPGELEERGGDGEGLACRLQHVSHLELALPPNMAAQEGAGEGEPEGGDADQGSQPGSSAGVGLLLAEAARQSRAARDRWEIPLSVQAHGNLELHGMASVPQTAEDLFAGIKGYHGQGRTRRTAKASKGSPGSKQRASEVQQIINKTAPAFGRGAAARFLSLAPERGPADS